MDKRNITLKLATLLMAGSLAGCATLGTNVTSKKQMIDEVQAYTACNNIVFNPDDSEKNGDETTFYDLSPIEGVVRVACYTGSNVDIYPTLSITYELGNGKMEELFDIGLDGKVDHVRSYEFDCVKNQVVSHDYSINILRVKDRREKRAKFYELLDKYSK